MSHSDIVHMCVCVPCFSSATLGVCVFMHLSVSVRMCTSVAKYTHMCLRKSLSQTHERLLSDSLLVSLVNALYWVCLSAPSRWSSEKSQVLLAALLGCVLKNNDGSPTERWWYAGAWAEIPTYSRLCLKIVVVASQIATYVSQATIAPTTFLMT